MSINRVIMSGNLTRDMEVRTTPSGTSVGTFGMAVNDRRKGPGGEWEDKPNYVDCTLYGGRANSLQQYLLKGTKVAVEGKLDWREWKAQDGSKRSKLSVVVDEIELMGKREQSNDYARPQQPRYTQQQYDDAYSDEDIPF